MYYIYTKESKPCHFSFVLKKPTPLLGYTYAKSMFNRFQRHVYIHVAALSGLLEEKYKYLK